MQEFLDFYKADGMTRWKAAKPEKRIDPANGEAYPQESFVQFYGLEKGTQRWNAATPATGASAVVGAAAPPPPAAPQNENDIDHDGDKLGEPVDNQSPGQVAGSGVTAADPHAKKECQRPNSDTKP